MRIIAVLGACVLALAATVTAQETRFQFDSPAGADDNSIIAHDWADDEPIETAFRYVTPKNETMTEVWLPAADILAAYNHDDDEQCATGPIDVLILVSACFNPTQIKSILTPIDAAMQDGTMTFYHDDHRIAVRPSFGIYYYDCKRLRIMPTFPNIPQVYFPTHRDVFVMVSEGTENSYLKVFALTGVHASTSLQIRTCANLKCAVGGKDLVIASPASITQSLGKIRDLAFCAKSTNPPTLYVDEQRRSQCACGCPAPFTEINGVCKCPGDQNIVDNQCRCPASGQSLVQGVCTCPVGLVQEGTECKTPLPNPAAIPETTPPPVPEEETTPPPVPEEETTPPPVPEEETTPPPVPEEETTPPPVPEEETTPPPVPEEGTTPPPVPEEGTTPPPVPEEETTPPPVPEEETTPPPVPEEGTTPPPVPEGDTTPPPVPEEETTPPPVPEEETTPPPVPEEETTPPPVPEEETTPPPVPEEETTPPPVPEEETTPPPVPEEETTPPPVPEEGTTPPPVPEEETTPPPVPEDETTPPPVPEEETTPPPVPEEETTPPPVQCSGGRVEQLDGSCACPLNQEAWEDDVCVDKCFWKTDKLGYKCQWSSQTKMSLKLKDDCAVDAPGASDVYVDDGRTNKYDTSLTRQDPLIELRSTPRGTSTSSTYQATWLNYETTPTSLEDSLTFSSFGVFDLLMTTTDYRKRARCSGCIAIVDDYQPTAIETCQSAGSVSVDFSSDSLDTTIAAESAFNGFYADTNVKDNGAVDEETGANERDDKKSAQEQDFFQSSYSVADFDAECFGASFVTDLLSKMTSDLDPDDLLECKRCCQKSTTLRGTYNDYSCDAAAGDPKYFAERSEDECSFDRCITMKAPDLVDASASITDPANAKSQKILDGLTEEIDLDAATIHRSIPCSTLDAEDASCKFSAKLSNLFEHSASWNAGLAIPSTYSVDDYVHWYYYVGVEAGKPWSADDQLVFTEQTTDVVIRAYTQCGMVEEFSYEVVLYPHSNHDACVSFDTKWLLQAPAPQLATPINPNDKPAWCAYPGSDFAAMEFTFNIDDILTHAANTVQGSYTNVQCYVTVAEDSQLDNVSEVELPLSSWSSGDKIDLDEKLALELVHNPTTAQNTDVRVRCDFTFQHYDESSTVNEPCNHEFSITACSGPKIEKRDDEVCTEGKCVDPVGAPGPFEACDGVVITTESGSATAIKSVDDTCCTSCSSTLQCTALPELSGVKRCEPAAPNTLVALTAAIQQGDFETSTMAVFGVSTMVAIVALVVIRRRAAAAAHEKMYDDVYYPLLE